MVDWSTLQCDMIGEILLSIDDLANFLRFPLVCRSWNDAYSMVKCKWRSAMPYLLLAENNKDNPDCVRNIFDLSRNKCYQFRLPETFGARCWGSNYGWIVTLDLELQLFLFNPLTKARIPLPPQSTMPDQEEPLTAEDVDDGEDHVALNALHNRLNFIANALVIKDVESGSDNNFVVLAVVGNCEYSLAFARPGDKTWTKIDPPEYTTEDDWPWFALPPFRHRVVDFVTTGTRVVILYGDASLGYLDISDLSTTNSFGQQVPQVKKLLPGIPKGLENTIIEHPSMYLLSDSSGDLRMVIRIKDTIMEEDNPENENPEEIYTDPDKMTYKTTYFEVYRLNSGTKEWKRLDKLGDVALFVGVGNSLSVRAPNSESCRSNCIYFTDDYAERWMGSNVGGHDIGVFDFESKQIEKFYEGDDNYSEFCPPLWFAPLL